LKTTIIQKSAPVIEKGKPIGKLKNNLMNMISDIIGQVERVKIDRITGANFTNFDKTAEYKKNERSLMETLDDMREAMMIEDEAPVQEEKTPETQETKYIPIEQRSAAKTEEKVDETKEIPLGAGLEAEMEKQKEERVPFEEGIKNAISDSKPEEPAAVTKTEEQIFEEELEKEKAQLEGKTPDKKD
jgi:hypothetical protein